MPFHKLTGASVLGVHWHEPEGTLYMLPSWLMREQETKMQGATWAARTGGDRREWYVVANVDARRAGPGPLLEAEAGL